MNIFTHKNFQALLLGIISIAGTVVMATCTNIPTVGWVLMGIFSFAGVLCNRFVYELAYFGNRVNSIFNRRYQDPESDEPSRWAVFCGTAGSYAIIGIQFILLFIY